MPLVEKSVRINAPVESVWSYVADPGSYWPRLTANVIKSEADPPGLAVVGQKINAVAKIAGRKVEGFMEATEVDPNKRLVITQRPGGLFKKFIGTWTLEAKGKGSDTSQSVDYEISMGYIGKILGKIVVNRAVRKDIDVFLRNLKEISELKPAP